MPVIGSPVTFVAAYVDQEYLEIVRGEKNIREWSNKDNENEIADTDAIQAAIETATAIVNANGLARYVKPVDLADDTAGWAILRRWAEVLASHELAVARGMNDNNPALNDLSRQRDQVMAEMGEYQGSVPARRFGFAGVAQPARQSPTLVL